MGVCDLKETEHGPGPGGETRRAICRNKGGAAPQKKMRRTAYALWETRFKAIEVPGATDADRESRIQPSSEAFSANASSCILVWHLLTGYIQALRCVVRNWYTCIYSVKKKKKKKRPYAS